LSLLPKSIQVEDFVYIFFIEYRIILKRYKKKYLGNKAKILKKFHYIMKNSITNKSAKTTLIQATKKKSRAKPKKDLNKKEDT
jgi:hypothetical protein